MQWKAWRKFHYGMAVIVFACLPLAINHSREWDSHKIRSTCKLDQAATSAAINHDIVEKRIIPQSDARPYLTVWNCPDGKKRTTRNDQLVGAQG